MTGQNKLLCSPLFLLITVQTLTAVTSTIIFLRLPSEPCDTCSLTPVDGHPDKTPRLPEEILNLFRFCTHGQWKPAVLAYTIVVLAFGAYSPSNFDIQSSKNSYVIDILAFLTVVFTARREMPPTSWGMRSLWTVILRDATLYFMIISSIQFCALLFLFVTTVSVILCVRMSCVHRDYVSAIDPNRALSVSPLSLTLMQPLGG